MNSAKEKMLRNKTNEFKGFPKIRGKGWPLTFATEKIARNLTKEKNWPKISIVTPSYNQGVFLEKTIRSVLLQGYPNLEYFIIDGGSTDNSIEVIKKYEPWITKWVSEKDRGQSHAINKGFAEATGDLLGWLNSDDYFLPGALFKLAKAYLETPSVGAVYGQGHIVDERGAIVHTPKLVPVTRESLFGWCFGNDFMQPSCLFTRKAWKEVGPLDERLNFALDVEYWIRIATRFEFKRIIDVLSVSLSHPKAKTTAMREKSHAELAFICMRYGEEKYATRILNKILNNYEDMKKDLDRRRNMSCFHKIFNVFRKALNKPKL